MSTISVNGTALHVQRMAPDRELHGDRAPTVVCVHGLVRDSLASFYFSLARALARSGFNVIMYDLRGHGGSAVPPRGYQLSDHLADLHGLIDQLVPDEQVHLIGNSFGGTLALAAAVQRPARVASAVVVEGFPPTPPWGERIQALMRGELRRLREVPVPGPAAHAVAPVQGRAVADTLRRWETTSLIAQIADGPWIEPGALAGLSCPVLALYGGESPLLAQSLELPRHLTRCETHVVAGHGHFVMVEAREEVNGIVVPWLRDVADRAQAPGLRGDRA